MWDEIQKFVSENTALVTGALGTAGGVGIKFLTDMRKSGVEELRIETSRNNETMKMLMENMRIELHRNIDENNKNDAKIDILAEQVRTYQNDIHGLKARLELAENALEKAQIACESSDRRAVAAENRAVAAEQQLKSATARITELEGEVFTLRGQMNDLSAAPVVPCGPSI